MSPLEKFYSFLCAGRVVHISICTKTHLYYTIYSLRSPIIFVTCVALHSARSNFVAWHCGYARTSSHQFAAPSGYSRASASISRIDSSKVSIERRDCKGFLVSRRHAVSGRFAELEQEDAFGIVILTKLLQMANRVTLPKRSPYNTKSNKRRVVKTPGGVLKYHYTGKQASSPKCGDCHAALPGVKALRPREYANVSKTKKTVQRAYGGSRCANCVRTRYVEYSWVSLSCTDSSS